MIAWLNYNLLIGSSCLPPCPFWCIPHIARLFYLKLDHVTPFLKIFNLFVVYSTSLLHASAFDYVLHCAWKALSKFLITYLANTYSSFKISSGTISFRKSSLVFPLYVDYVLSIFLLLWWYYFIIICSFICFSHLGYYFLEGNDAILPIFKCWTPSTGFDI